VVGTGYLIGIGRLARQTNQGGIEMKDHGTTQGQAHRRHRTSLFTGELT
jgi:hypothetical protein